MAVIATAALLPWLTGCSHREAVPSAAFGSLPGRTTDSPEAAVCPHHGSPIEQWLLGSSNANTLRLESASTALDLDVSVILSFAAADQRQLQLVFIGRGGHESKGLAQRVIIFWKGDWKGRCEVLAGSRLEACLVHALRRQRDGSFNLPVVKNCATAIDLLQNRELPWPPRSTWYLDWGASQEQREFDQRPFPIRPKEMIIERHE